jgi:head-tail adaptor
MSIQTLMTDTVTILHPALTTDTRGNSVKDWVHATAVTSNAWITQTESFNANELEDHREGTASLWKLFLPIGVAIDNLCRVVYGSYTLEVESIPIDAKTPSYHHHQELALKMVIG